MKKIITTVGTSILTNYQKKEVILCWTDAHYKKIDAWVDKIERESNSASDITKFKTEANNIKKTIQDYWLKGIQKNGHNYIKTQDEDELNLNASAEIKSILAIAGIQKPEDLQEKVEIYLLATDTVLSVLACELIVEWFKAYPNFEFPEFEIINDEIKCKSYKNLVVEGLQIHNGKEFSEKGLESLFNILHKITKEEFKKFIFNITGGYKAVIPILTLIGQIYDSEINYIYEESSDLIEFPSLPINFDWQIAQTVVQYLSDNILKAINQTKNPLNKQLDSLDENVLESLKSYKLITNDKTQVTPFGNWLINFVEKRSEVSKDSVLGIMMELKFYEYFNENSQEYHKPTRKERFDYFVNEKTFEIFDEVELRNKYIQVNEESISDFIRVLNEDLKNANEKVVTLDDIDILVKRKCDDKPIICESKARNLVAKNYLKKIKYRLDGYKKKYGIYPAEYIFCIYKVKFKIEIYKDFQQDKSLLDTLKELKNKIESEYTNIKFKAIGCYIDLITEGLKVNYDSLLRSELQIIPIQID